MNKGVIVAAFAALMVATASFDAAAQDAALEAQLKELAKSPPDIATAGKWFKLKDSVTDNGRRQEILKAAAAALILSKKGDAYQTRVRPLLDDAAGFEESFLAPCSECGGDGTSSKACPACKGSGRCQFGNCQGGRRHIQQITGDKYVTCSECKGSGRCQKCGGKGKLNGKCIRCGGKGRSFRTDLAQKAYHDHANAASVSAEHKTAQENRQRASAATGANSTIPHSQPEKGSSSKYEIIPEHDDNYEADKQTQTTSSQNSQPEDKETQDMYASKTLDEVYMDALDALNIENGGNRDVVRAYKGFEEAEKRGYKPAEMAVAHMCWTMTDDERTMLRDAGVDVPSGWFFVFDMMHAANVLKLRLAKCELGLLEIGRGNYSKGIILVQDAADKGLLSAKIFLVQLEKLSAQTGKSKDFIAEILTRNEETLSKFQEMCEKELRTEYLLSLKEDGNDAKHGEVYGNP